MKKILIMEEDPQIKIIVKENNEDPIKEIDLEVKFSFENKISTLKLCFQNTFINQKLDSHIVPKQLQFK